MRAQTNVVVFHDLLLTSLVLAPVDHATVGPWGYEQHAVVGHTHQPCLVLEVPVALLRGQEAVAVRLCDALVQDVPHRANMYEPARNQLQPMGHVGVERRPPSVTVTNHALALGIAKPRRVDCMSVDMSPDSKSLTTPVAPTHAGFHWLFLSCAATLDSIRIPDDDHREVESLLRGVHKRSVFVRQTTQHQSLYRGSATVDGF